MIYFVCSLLWCAHNFCSSDFKKKSVLLVFLFVLVKPFELCGVSGISVFLFIWWIMHFFFLHSALIWQIFLGTKSKCSWPTSSLKMCPLRMCPYSIDMQMTQSKGIRNSTNKLWSSYLHAGMCRCNLQPFSVVMIGSSKCEISMRVDQWLINTGDIIASKSRANMGSVTKYLQ